MSNRLQSKFSMVGARKNKSGKECFENTKLYEAITGESIFQITAYLKQKISGFTSLFFFLNFPSETFTIHRIAGRERLSSLSSLLLRHLDINRDITAESSRVDKKLAMFSLNLAIFQVH